MLLSFLALIVVSSFESVGAILVIALLSIPSASAYLFARSPRKMLLFANLHGLLSCLIGFFLAQATNANIAASIAVVAGCIFVGELFFLSSEEKLSKLLAPVLRVHSIVDSGISQQERKECWSSLCCEMDRSALGQS